MSRVDAFLDLLVKQSGSDLHLVSGNPPRIRLYGEIHPIKYRELTESETEDLMFEIMSERVKTVFKEKGGLIFPTSFPRFHGFASMCFGISVALALYSEQSPMRLLNWMLYVCRRC